MIQDPGSKNQLPQADSIHDFLRQYADLVRTAVQKIPAAELQAVCDLLVATQKAGGKIFVGGNGGSAAISDHLCCDWTKGTYIEGKPPLRTESLTANTAVLTALANDFGYETVLSRQLEMVGKPGDVVILISSSGNSPNVLRAAEVARKKSIKVLAFSGFSGGKLRDLADHCLHIALENYGMVEDGHQMLMHTLAQYLRMKRS